MIKKLFTFKQFLIILFTLSITTSLFSQTYKSATDGDWDDPLTWDLYQVPPITDNGKNSTVIVIIFHDINKSGDLNTGTYSNITIHSTGSLNVKGSLNLKNQNNIIIDGTFDVNGNYTCNGGQIYVSGNGTMNINGNDNGCPMVLPIELKSFSVENVNNSNNVKWVTSSEKNNSHFIVEYSNDGFYWSEIGKVNGIGNSTTETSYSIAHNNYENGQNYYKLTQVDFDGETEEFHIITINNIINEITLIGIYNQVGQEVNENYSGVKIYKYSDGTFNRVINN